MGEFGDCSDEIEGLCRFELKKCLRVPEEQAPLKGLDLTYTGHPMKILETSERESYTEPEEQGVQNAMEWPHRENEPRKTYPEPFASQPRISGRDSCKGVGFV